MAEYTVAKYRAPAGSKLRWRAAGLLALLSAAMFFIALKFETKPYLTAAAARHASQRYSRLWFDVADDLVGAYFRENHLVVERWAGNNPAATWQFPIGPADLWAFAGDNSLMAWSSGKTLHWQAARAGATPLSVSLDQAPPLALSVLSDGSVAAVFPDAVARWNAATGQKIEEWRTGLAPADRAAAEGDSIAFSSLQDGELRVFSLQNSHWIQTQQALSPEIPERVVLPAPSVAGTMAEGRIRVGGITRSSPGFVRSVAAHLYDVIAAGDFEGIYALTPDGEDYRVAAAAPASEVACGQASMAVSAGNGTTLFNLGSEVRLTRRGRTVSGIALGSIFLAALLAFAPFLLQALAVCFRILLRRAPRRGTAPAALAPPPADLIHACASGRMVLWAGAGLSAQCGFPLRTSFVANMIQAVELESPGMPALRKCKALAESGNSETALNELVAAMETQRGALLGHFTATFARFTALSRSHESLARMDFSSVVTTNYDILLEKTWEDCARKVITPARGALNGPGLLKLFGSLMEPVSVLLSQAEFRASLGNPNIEALRELFADRPMLFLGCSLEGLLADLSAIGMPERVPQMRFAVAGVSAAWEKVADQLQQRYGIHVLACTEETIGDALPRFLDALSRAADQVRRGIARPLSTAKTA